MNNYIGKIRLFKQPDLYFSNENSDGIFEDKLIEQPPKLQQFDGKDWVDVEIVELEDKVTI